MGALWARSKPRGLDVGVLPYGFLLFYLKTFISVRLLPARNEFCARSDESIKNSIFETGSWMRFGGIVFVGAILESGIMVHCFVSVSHADDSNMQGVQSGVG